MPKVSIIIPCYNVEKFIESCLNSIIIQTYQDFEIIIVNDGSTDKTASIIFSFIEKYKSAFYFKYIYQDNKGPSSARNNGISAARGEYIALIDSDDIWKKDALEKKMNLFKNGNISCVYADALMVYSPENQKSLKKEYGKFIKGNIYPELLNLNYININVVFRKTVLNECGLFDETLRTCEDYDLWIRMAFKGYLFDYVDEPLTYVRIRDNSLSKNKLQMYKDMITVYDKALKRTRFGHSDYQIAYDKKKYFEKLFIENMFVMQVLKKDYRNAKITLKSCKKNYKSVFWYYLKYIIFNLYPNYFFNKFIKQEKFN